MSSARKLGETLGPFDLVVTSVVPRARETAIAMGFAVDHEIVTLSTEEDVYREAEARRWWTDGQPMAALAEIVMERGALWRYGSSLAAVWRDLLTPHEDGRKVLVIGHSGELELALVCCFPDADHASWGEAFSPLEGARLYFEGERTCFTGLELLRNPPSTA